MESTPFHRLRCTVVWVIWVEPRHCTVAVTTSSTVATAAHANATATRPRDRNEHPPWQRQTTMSAPPRINPTHLHASHAAQRCSLASASEKHLLLVHCCSHDDDPMPIVEHSSTLVQGRMIPPHISFARIHERRVSEKTLCTLDDRNRTRVIQSELWASFLGGFDTLRWMRCPQRTWRHDISKNRVLQSALNEWRPRHRRSPEHVLRGCQLRHRLEGGREGGGEVR